MRFDNINNFGIDDLMLDEGNYRFKKAANQQECIEKIFNSNKQYFTNLMKSIAEDDLGELLLVYNNSDDLIVLDGNRRTAAIKVLNNPELAPTPSLKKAAEKLRIETKFDFNSIQAQVSDSKDKIYITVYERHAAGKGKARISWSAIAAARFRYDQKIQDNEQEWYSIALVFAVESKHKEVTEFIDSSKYSHEVFRRVVSAAISSGIIAKSIFNDKEMRIKKTPKKLVNDAIGKALVFLRSLQSKELSLSRTGETYADSDKIKDYLSQFSTDIPPSTEPVNNDAEPIVCDPSPTENEHEEGTGNNESEGDNTQQQNDDADDEILEPNSANRIQKSEDVIRKIKRLPSEKLLQLYNSMCVISLKQHASLMHICAWALFESLATLAGKTANNALEAFYGSKINEWYKDKGVRHELKTSIKYVREEGDANKHGAKSHSIDARQLRVHFDVLEGLILKTLDAAIAAKKNN